MNNNVTSTSDGDFDVNYEGTKLPLLINGVMWYHECYPYIPATVICSLNSDTPSGYIWAMPSPANTTNNFCQVEGGVSKDLLSSTTYASSDFTPEEDNVNHPSHYTQGAIECIDVIAQVTEGLEGMEAVDTAQVIKYIFRWKHKNGLEDLKKAKWYLEDLIKRLEK